MLRRVKQYLVQRPVVWRARIGLERSSSWYSAPVPPSLLDHYFRCARSGCSSRSCGLRMANSASSPSCCRPCHRDCYLVWEDLHHSLGGLLRRHRLCRFMPRLRCLRASSLRRRLQLAHPVHDPLQVRHRPEPQVSQGMCCFSSELFSAQRLLSFTSK